MSNQDLQVAVESAEPRFLAIQNDTTAFAREKGFALQILTANSYLAETARRDPDALVAAVTNVAAVGLSLNPVTRHAYLVPRKGRVCLDIGAAGFVHLARLAGLRDLAFGVVREHDVFVMPSGGERVQHTYDPFADRGDWKGAYCQHVYNDGVVGQCVTLDRPEIEKRRAMSETWKKNHGAQKEYRPCGSCIWCQWPEEMILKTVLRYARRWWPATPALDAAMAVTEGDFRYEATDSNAPEGGALCLSADQVKAVKDRAHEAGLPWQEICNRYGVSSIDSVEAEHFGPIMAKIADFEAAKAARAARLQEQR